MKISEIHSLFLNSNGVITDTRKIKPKSIFFALRGPNFNANEFASQALQEGASYAFVDEKKYAVSESHILVEDCLESLQELATYHRNYLGIPIIALTGSNGKTTTKELINIVLSKKYITTATQGNLNNHIGVPLTLLSMTKETQIGIVEMGANHHGEIAKLMEITQPDYGYITNFGKAHLEGFGSVEGVKKAKGELYDYLKKYDKHIFLNVDDATQQKQLSYNNIFTFGKTSEADIQYKITEEDPFVAIEINQARIQSKLTGSYNATNIAAAASIGIFFQIDIMEITQAIEYYEPSNNRSQVLEMESNKILLDAYNANPTSMEAAINSFATKKADKKVLILGDMFEMGNAAAEEHQNIINLIEQMNFLQVFVVGENFFQTKTEKDFIQKFRTKAELKEIFSFKKFSNTNFLIKGSRGMALEELI